MGENFSGGCCFGVGFFVEDYKFDGSGDLDEYNGRYERNDDFPNGVYAYHATIDEFPYFIGNKYRSEPVFDSNLDQFLIIVIFAVLNRCIVLNSSLLEFYNKNIKIIIFHKNSKFVDYIF